MSTGMNSPASTHWLPQGTRPAQLVVCERTGQWTLALERHLPELRIHQTRSLADVWDVLGKACASFVVVEVTWANLEALLEFLLRLPRHHPLGRVAVVSDRSLRASEDLLREAGAVDFVVSPRALAPLAQCVQRHLHHAPAPARSLTERIWAELPWGRHDP